MNTVIDFSVKAATLEKAKEKIEAMATKVLGPDHIVLNIKAEQVGGNSKDFEWKASVALVEELVAPMPIPRLPSNPEIGTRKEKEDATGFYKMLEDFKQGKGPMANPIVESEFLNEETNEVPSDG